MWIKKLYANFGKLNNQTLDLSPGLNIVSGKNESGKSTWSAFIRTMFFGISTKEKAKQGFIPDKEKYLPWNGSAMYGKMELCRGEDEITIERTPSRSGAVFTKEEAITAKGEPAPTGEALLGIAKGVYERTAFIGQSAISIDGDKDTEKRILSIASSGDESISAGEVINRLEKKRRELRALRGGGGTLSSLETEISSLLEALRSGNETSDEISATLESLEVTDDRIKKVSRSLAIAKAESLRSQRGILDGAKASLREKEEALRLTEGFTTREAYDNFLAKKSDMQALMLEAEKSNSILRSAEAELTSRSEEVSSFRPFGGMNRALAEKTAEEDMKKLSDLPASKSGVAILLLILGIVGTIFGVLISPLIFIAAALFFASGIALFSLSGKKRTLILSSLREKYGNPETAEIQVALEKYLALTEEVESLSRSLKALREKATALNASADVRRRDVAEIMAPLGFSLSEADKAQEKMRQDMLCREKALSDYTSAKIRLDALLQTSSEEATETLDYTEDEIPKESAEELSELLDGLTLRKKNLEMTLAALRERIRGFDKEEAEKKLQKLSADAEKLSEEYDALTLAIDTLDSSHCELKSRFSPAVEKRASEIFNHICGGGFEVVRVLDSNFDMNVSENAASAPRDKLFLSGGTYDELYLALRLALCDTILPEEEMPPMVLDDALVNFDDERAFRTLLYLKDLAKTRQIILFTCHTREAKFFEEDSEVNKIAI